MEVKMGIALANESRWRSPDFPFPMSFPTRILSYIIADLTVINLLIYYGLKVYHSAWFYRQIFLKFSCWRYPWHSGFPPINLPGMVILGIKRKIAVLLDHAAELPVPVEVIPFQQRLIIKFLFRYPDPAQLRTYLSHLLFCLHSIPMNNLSLFSHSGVLARSSANLSWRTYAVGHLRVYGGDDCHSFPHVLTKFTDRYGEWMRKPILYRYRFLRSHSTCGLRYRYTISHFSSWNAQGITSRVSPSRIQTRFLILPLMRPMRVTPSPHRTLMWFAPIISSAEAKISRFLFFGRRTRTVSIPDSLTSWTSNSSRLISGLFLIATTPGSYL